MNGNGEAGCRFHFDTNLVQGETTFGGIELYQIGELCCEGGYEVLPHSQYCMEISYIVSGSGYFHVDDACIPVKAGDLFFNNAGPVHAIRTNPSSMLRYMYVGFAFNEQASEAFAGIDAFFRAEPYYHCADAHHLLQPFNRNIDEFYTQQPHSNVMIRTYLEQLIVLAYRALSDSSGNAGRYAPHTSSRSVGHTVYAVIRYVERHLTELGSIRTMADELGYSYTYLSHLFKNKTGMTLQRYINHKKAEKALEMMQYGEISMRDIADRLGYETLQSFSKAFSRVMGHPPSYYAAARRPPASGMTRS